MKLERSIRIATTIAAAAALAACGGGGGGSGADSSGLPSSASGVTGDFDANTYTSVAASAAASLAPSSSLAAIGISVLAQAAAGDGDRSVALQADGLQRRSAMRVQAQAVYEDVESCAGGGTFSAVTNDADNSNDYSAGDSWSETYSNCSLGGIVLNGSGQATVRSASGSSIDVAISINQLSFGGATLNGSGSLALSASASGYAATLAYAGMSMAVAGAGTTTLGHTTAVTYTTSTGALTLALDGAVAFDGESFWLDQGSPFGVPSGKSVPRSGDLTISDKDGDRVVITGSLQGLRYEFYKAGSTTPDASGSGLAAD